MLLLQEGGYTICAMLLYYYTVMQKMSASFSNKGYATIAK